MATSVEIKSNNNTLIREKTNAKSITKVNVADQLDAGIDYTVQEIALKVDKVAGKGLSSNDYTSADKNKLDGIATGAEVNVNADWNATSGDAQILNKPTIPSISGLATVTYVDTQDALKVDKVVGKGLSTEDYTTTEKNKLSGIAIGAEVNVNADWNATSGDAQILNKPTIPSVGENVTKVQKTTITSAQILNLFTTPITVLNAFTTNLKYPINIYIRRNIGNGYTLANNMFSIVDEANVVVENSIDASFLAFNYSSSTGFTQKSLSINVSSGSEDRRYSYKLKANVGNPTSGTGDIDVYVTYIEITL